MNLESSLSKWGYNPKKQHLCEKNSSRRTRFRKAPCYSCHLGHVEFRPRYLSSGPPVVVSANYDCTVWAF